MKKERPILFNESMVKAILAGTKTQTRRPIKRPPVADLIPGTVGLDSSRMSEWVGEMVTGQMWRSRCEVADIGDLLWVRETAFIAPPNFSDADERDLLDDQGRRRTVGYVASMDAEARRCAYEYGVKKTPSIHFPRWAARIFLRVTDIRLQRVQEISEQDALAEGITENDVLREKLPSARDVFSQMWKCLYEGSWERNGWVWAISFERVEAPARNLSAGKRGKP